jgi:hypothetical protein
MPPSAELAISKGETETSAQTCLENGSNQWKEVTVNDCLLNRRWADGRMAFLNARADGTLQGEKFLNARADGTLQGEKFLYLVVREHTGTLSSGPPDK